MERTQRGERYHRNNKAVRVKDKTDKIWIRAEGMVGAKEMEPKQVKEQTGINKIFFNDALDEGAGAHRSGCREGANNHFEEALAGTRCEGQIEMQTHPGVKIRMNPERGG